MMGFLTFQVGFVSAILLITLWFIARHEADLDWPKLMMVTAATGVLCVLPPMFLIPPIIERFHIEVIRAWPLLLLAVLAWNIGAFVLMLNKFVWVPVPKALIAWVVVQVAVASRDGVFAMLKGERFTDSAWTSVTGMPPPRKAAPPPKMDADTRAALEDLKRMAGGGPVLVPDLPEEATNQTGAVVATPAPLPVPVPATPPATPSPVELPVTPTPVVNSEPAAMAPDASPDPGWGAAEKLLVFKGKSVRNGRVSIFVNNTEAEIGDIVAVTYQGRRYTWKLVGVDGLRPKWQSQVQPVELPTKR